MADMLLNMPKPRQPKPTPQHVPDTAQEDLWGHMLWEDMFGLPPTMPPAKDQDVFASTSPPAKPGRKRRST